MERERKVVTPKMVKTLMLIYILSNYIDLKLNYDL